MKADVLARWAHWLSSGEYGGLFLTMPGVADLERWLSRVEFTDSCWIWTAARNGDGYPYTNLRSEIFRGNRLFWMLENRRVIPLGKVVCYSCDNRACVNPKHLWLGSLTDNNKDRAQKGRNRDQRGTKNNQSRLTDEKVAEIRRLYAAGLGLQREIAAQFGVTQTMVGNIVRGEAWTHVQRENQS